MPSEEALERQSRQNREYLHYLKALPAAHKRRLFNQLSAADQEQARKHGLAHVLLEQFESDQGRKDVSEWVDLALPEVLPPEKVADCLSEQFDLPPAVAADVAPWIEKLIEAEAERRKSRQLARIVATLLKPGNVVVRNHCLAIAAQLDEMNSLGYENLTEAGRHLGTSKQNVSKGVNEWCDLLDLPRPPLLKSEEARATFSTDKKKAHWRTTKCQPTKKAK